jgi:hypothetical protein
MGLHDACPERFIIENEFSPRRHRTKAKCRVEDRFDRIAEISIDPLVVVGQLDSVLGVNWHWGDAASRAPAELSRLRAVCVRQKRI